MRKSTKKRIVISVDGIHAGTGQFNGMHIDNCGVEFCRDNEASLAVYDLIEAAIADGRNEITCYLDGDECVIDWHFTDDD